MTDTTRERLSSLIREAVIRLKSSETMDAVADHLIAHGVTLSEPPAPAPPKPTWEPSEKATMLLLDWWREDENECGPFLRRLYAQLHRDRVAALPVPSWDDPTIAVIRTSKEQVSVARTMLLALADDGNGA